MIPLARPWIGTEELRAADSILRSGMLVQGHQVAAFEEELAERCERQHAVVCSSGTAALQLALAALELGKGEILCPNLSWPSPAHAVVSMGASLTLVDIDSASWNGSPTEFQALRNDRSVAAIVIDQFGMPSDHTACATALQDLPIVVDAACAIGAEWKGRASASYGTIACLSFHPRKLITTGEGGACITDEPELARRMRMLRNHGQASRGVFEQASGNYRLTDLAAAIGRAQLQRLDAIITRRRTIADRYQKELDHRLQTQQVHPDAKTTWQTFGIRCPDGTDTSTRDAFVKRLNARQVQTGILSYAIHQLDSIPAQTSDRFKHSSALAALGFAIPMHPLLTDEDVDTTIQAVNQTAQELLP